MARGMLLMLGALLFSGCEGTATPTRLLYEAKPCGCGLNVQHITRAIEVVCKKAFTCPNNKILSDSIMELNSYGKCVEAGKATFAKVFKWLKVPAPVAFDMDTFLSCFEQMPCIWFQRTLKDYPDHPFHKCTNIKSTRCVSSTKISVCNHGGLCDIQDCNALCKVVDPGYSGFCEQKDSDNPTSSGLTAGCDCESSKWQPPPVYEDHGIPPKPDLGTKKDAGSTG